MAFISVSELTDIVVMSFFVGFIFSDVFSRRTPSVMLDSEGRPIPSYSVSRWNWNDIKFAALATAPAVILHEFGHKIVAMLFGMGATFHAAYGWLILGVALKIIGFPFIFFVPAYVSIIGNTSPLNYSLIAAAGPFVNALLWLSASLFEKNMGNMNLSSKQKALVVLTKQINKFLFIFNMIPLPGFDGSKVFGGLMRAVGL
ncbi:hypothetical protein D6764_02195 [Candidatus Woesearchaeota archaeon]|nr:MAG: hypothetical protein D6764_02195 [Candidatus Woesearchaeota archaeon]